MGDYDWIQWLGLKENYQSLSKDDAKALAIQIAHELAALQAERDKYKPFHDAIIDMAVVNWTLDGMTERDAYDAIKKLVHCYCMERSDPAVSEAMASLQARADSAEAKLARVVELARDIRCSIDPTCGCRTCSAGRSALAIAEGRDDA